MDTLAHVRRVRRFIKSQERRALKRKMDGYNSLAAAGRGRVDDKQSLDTTHDISQLLTEQMSRHTYDRDTRIRRQDNSRADEIASSVVCDEVRNAWHARIGMIHMLSDDTRKKLQDMAVSKTSLRDARLNDLVAWMVTQWCDVEGYDPEKHPKRSS